ncbi:tetratricopeptide repeat protein, partial [Zavarzinella formosa]|uniref:tetratricopeptide repeat protein n=1 Tax=Zavarzinella formosa TaxID=360055 RepID=UPI00138AB7B6
MITQTRLLVVLLASVVCLPAVAQPGSPPAPSAGQVEGWKREYLQRIGEIERLYAGRKFVELPPLVNEAADRMLKVEIHLKDRRSRVELAVSWALLGAIHEQFGKPGEAVRSLLRAEALWDGLIRDGQIGNETLPDDMRKVYTNPHHHNFLQQFGMMSLRLGEPEKGVAYIQRVVTAESAAYDYTKKTKTNGKDYPDFQLPGRLEALGVALISLGKPKDALPHLKRAVEMYEPQYADQKAREKAIGKPKRDPLLNELAGCGRELASTYLHLSMALEAADRDEEAGRAIQKAIQIYKDDYPDDHPGLVYARQIWASSVARRDRPAALKIYRDTGDMLAKSYPPKAFPDGHPALAEHEEAVGRVLLADGRHKEAAQALRRSFDYNQKLLTAYAAAMSESEALAYLGTLPTIRDQLLSSLEHVPDSAGEAYEVVWQAKSQVTRVVRARQIAGAVRLSDDKQARADWEKLIAVRRQLGLFAQEPTGDLDQQAEEVGKLARRREELERSLADKFGGAATRDDAAGASPSKLLASLPK